MDGGRRWATIQLSVRDFGTGLPMARRLAVDSGYERYISNFRPQVVFRFRGDTL